MTSFFIVLAIVVLCFGWVGLSLAGNPGPTRLLILKRRYGVLGPLGGLLFVLVTLGLAFFSTTAAFVFLGLVVAALLAWCYRPTGWPFQNYGRPSRFGLREIRNLVKNAGFRIYFRSQWPSVARTSGLVSIDVRGDSFGADLSSKFGSATRLQWEPYLSRGRATGPSITTWRVYTARGKSSEDLIALADVIAEAYRIPMVTIRPDRPGRCLLTAYFASPTGSNSVIDEELS